MPTRAGETMNGGVGAAAKQVAEHASAIARLEVLLATAELKRKGIAHGLGGGLGRGPALFGLVAFGFGFATAAAARALVAPSWLARLIATGSLFGLAGVLGAL